MSEIIDNRQAMRSRQREVCRTCGSLTVHTQSYLTPTIGCIDYLRKQLASANKGAQTNARVNQLLAERVNLIQAELASAVEVIKHYAVLCDTCDHHHPNEYCGKHGCKCAKHVNKAAEWLKEFENNS